MQRRAANIADVVFVAANGMRKKPISVVLTLCVVLLAAFRPGCRHTAIDGWDGMAQIHEDMRPIETATGGYAESVRTYLHYYGLDMGDGVRHRFGTFESGEWVLAGHLYEPGEYRGTVILLHGYLNHCGQFRHLVRRLLEEGYAVAMYDMPGHGLSSGERAVIDDFSQYGEVLADFVKVVRGLADGPLDLIGFSTGGTVAIDWLLTREEAVFRRVILAAPLVRSPQWESSMRGAKFYSHFTDKVPRLPRTNTSDADYVRFNRREDVLHCREVSLRWFLALEAWNERMAEVGASGRGVDVIQGTKDTTVDYKYNLGFIGEKFAVGEVTFVEGAGHELFNEADDLREEVLDAAMRYLDGDEGRMEGGGGEDGHDAGGTEE